MKTQIFDNYSDFTKRADKRTNGATQSFADAYPGWDKERGNEACWNCSGCSGCSDCYDCSGCSGCSDCYDCSGCSGCSDCSGCSGCSDCSGCSGCSDCYDCSDCSDCYDCSDCSRCSDCSDCSGAESNLPPVPKIAGIHAAVLRAVEKPGALAMDTWHTCETTHCRAGWVVHLAGKQAKAFESATSTLFAAMMIYKASSPIAVSTVRYYDSNETALADMRKCAAEETEASR